jgi:hypothetical protein
MGDGGFCHYCRRAACICCGVEELCRKIDGYRHLKPNWDGEDGDEIDERCIAQAKKFIHDVAMVTAKKGCSWREPMVAPFADGGVDAWWDLFPLPEEDDDNPWCGIYFCPQVYPNVEVVDSDDTCRPSLIVLSEDEAFAKVIETLKAMDTYVHGRQV